VRLACGKRTRLLLRGLVIGAVVRSDHQVDLERGLHSSTLSTVLRSTVVGKHMPDGSVA
jgi:hypothetical protein